MQAAAVPADAALATRLACLEAEVERLRGQVADVQERLPERRLSLCVVSGEFEKVTTALMLANMAAALDMKVTLFFAFWGVQAVTAGRRFRGKNTVERALTLMRRPDIEALSSHRFNFGGLGPAVFTRLMKHKGIATPAELLETARALGVELQACTTSMEVFGLRADELVPGVASCGAAQFLDVAGRSSVSLML
jgi:peroxiredoxin family protein